MSSSEESSDEEEAAELAQRQHAEVLRTARELNQTVSPVIVYMRSNPAAEIVPPPGYDAAMSMRFEAARDELIECDAEVVGRTRTRRFNEFCARVEHTSAAYPLAVLRMAYKLFVTDGYKSSKSAAWIAVVEVS
jgi:hypothetical protein